MSGEPPFTSGFPAAQADDGAPRGAGSATPASEGIPMYGSRGDGSIFEQERLNPREGLFRFEQNALTGERVLQPHPSPWFGELQARAHGLPAGDYDALYMFRGQEWDSVRTDPIWGAPSEDLSARGTTPERLLERYPDGRFVNDGGMGGSALVFVRPRTGEIPNIPPPALEDASARPVTGLGSDAERGAAAPVDADLDRALREIELEFGRPAAPAAGAGADCPSCTPGAPSGSQIAREALASGLSEAPPPTASEDVRDPARAASGEDDARAAPQEDPRAGAADDPRPAAGVPDDAPQAFDRARQTPGSRAGGELYAVGGTPDNPQFYRGTPDGQYLGTVDRVPRGAEFGVSDQMIQMNNPGAPGRAFVADGEGRRYAVGPQGAAEIMGDGSMRTLDPAERRQNAGMLTDLAARHTGLPMGGRGDADVWMMGRARTAGSVIDGAQNQGDAHAAGLPIGGANAGRRDVHVPAPRPPPASPFRR